MVRKREGLGGEHGKATKRGGGAGWGEAGSEEAEGNTVQRPWTGRMRLPASHLGWATQSHQGLEQPVRLSVGGGVGVGQCDGGGGVALARCICICISYHQRLLQNHPLLPGCHPRPPPSIQQPPPLSSPLHTLILTPHPPPAPSRTAHHVSACRWQPVSGCTGH